MRRVQIRRADIGCVADSRAHGERDSSLGLGRRDRRGDPRQNELEDGEGAHCLQEHCLADINIGLPRAKLTYKVSRSRAVGGHGNDLTDGGENRTENDVEASLLSLAAMPRVRDREDAREEIGRRSEQQGLDIAVSEGLHDRWEEVWERGVSSYRETALGECIQVKLMLTTAPVSIRTNSQVLGSVAACLRPTKTDWLSTSSLSPSLSTARRY